MSQSRVSAHGCHTIICIMCMLKNTSRSSQTLLPRRPGIFEYVGYILLYSSEGVSAIYLMGQIGAKLDLGSLLPQDFCP